MPGSDKKFKEPGESGEVEVEQGDMQSNIE